jgi:hypothetical protein
LISAKLKKGLVFVLVVIAGIIAALVLYFYQFFYQTDQFLPGVAIATVPVGGQDRYEVASDIEAHFDRLYQTPVNFYFREFSYSTTMGEICKKASIDKVIDEIWEQEQERGIRSKLLNLDGARVIAYAPPIEYNQAVLEKLAEEWNQHIGQPPVDPQLEVDRDRGLIVVPGKEGKQVNIAATWDTMPTQWSAWEELKIPIVVDQVYPSISEEDLKVMGELSSAITWYNSGGHLIIIPNSLIHTQLYILKFLLTYRRQMRKVKTQTIGFHQRALLLGMVAQNLAQSSMQKVGGGMVASRIQAQTVFYLKLYRLSFLKGSVYHAQMDDPVRCFMN